MELNLNIPNNWDGVTLSQFQEIAELNDEDSSIKKFLNILSILTDTDEDVIRKIPLENLNELYQSLTWVENKPTTNHKNILTINKIQYHLIPLKLLTIGEHIDLEFYSKDLTTNLHSFLSILYREKIKNKFVEYDTNDAEQRALLFKDNVMISDVYGSSLFFSLVGIQLLNNSLDYMTMTELQQIAMNYLT